MCADVRLRDYKCEIYDLCMLNLKISRDYVTQQPLNLTKTLDYYPVNCQNTTAES